MLRLVIGCLVLVAVFSFPIRSFVDPIRKSASSPPAPHPAPAPFGEITSLPGYGAPKDRQWSGYITVRPETNSNLFYWWIQCPDPQAPFVVWFQGGPGSSSIGGGLFLENGPYRIQQNQTLQDSPTSWHLIANVMYVDQPAGTGYSYTDKPEGYAHSMDDVAKDVVSFFRGFYARFPALARKDLYLFGESYGGKYVPAIATALLAQGTEFSQLKGIALGDGWTDPPIQISSWSSYSLLSGLIDEAQLRTVEDGFMAGCKFAISRESWHEATPLCDAALNLIVQNYSGGINQYDIRRFDMGFDFRSLGRYLKSPQLMKAIYATHTIGSTEEEVSQALYEDVYKPFGFVMPALMEKIKVLVYQGQFDLIVSARGVDDLYSQLDDWSGHGAFLRTKREVWKVGDDVAGYLRRTNDFSYLLLTAAGHMSPSDQPKHLFAMLQAFLKGDL